MVVLEANTIPYAFFAVFGWLGGATINWLKPKYTLILGAVGYPIYAGSLWYYDSTGRSWFPLLGGTVLGISGACLWTGAGLVAFSYAEEKHKGLVSI